MILTEADKVFIKKNLFEKVEKLLLSSQLQQLPNFKFIAEQINSRQKIKDKLPSWYQNLDLILPKSISVEQSSSEITANYKSNLFSGELMIDLTGGLGIDFFAFSKNFKKGIYCEQNIELKNIAEKNAQTLGIKNTEFHSENSIDFIEKFNGAANLIYLDPARRNTLGGKVFSLSDCEPNILEIKDLLFKKTNKILLKCSPMLDISQAINQLENVTATYIITTDNEVKELLFVLEKNIIKPKFTKVVHFYKQKIDEFTFTFENETALNSAISKPLKYIYEPHAGLMKAAAFKSISDKFNLAKLHQNTHLYTSNELLGHFQGRIFELKDILKVDKKLIKTKIPDLKANLTVRNFPDTVANLKKKLGLTDGGAHYLFACTNNLNEKIILQTIKIN